MNCCLWVDNSISITSVGHQEVELRHLESRRVSRSGQSLMTSISGLESQIELNIGGTHRLMIINQHTKCHQNRRRSCKFHSVFDRFDMECPAPMVLYISSYYVRCLSSLFPTTARRFVIKAHVDDAILDFIGVLIVLTILVALLLSCVLCFSSWCRCRLIIVVSRISFSIHALVVPMSNKM